MKHLLLFAERNAEINKWLGEHPMVLGLMFLAIGAAVGGWGLYELKTGVAHTKRGRAMEGTQAKVLAIVRILVGLICICFALFKMVSA